MSTTQLGLGLIGIGRPWPSSERAVPTRPDVEQLLTVAVGQGVQFFDTAPAYGSSEQRLGDYLARMDRRARDRLTVATKCGEQWNPDSGSRTDHHPDALRSSVQTSMRVLGHIDILQLHQADAPALQTARTLDCLVQLQREHSIAALGASVKTVNAAQAAVDAAVFSYVQMPINPTVPDLVEWAREHNRRIRIIGNRPFASGRHLKDMGGSLAFSRSVVGPDGVVLTGTTNPQHLAETRAVW